MVNFERMTNRLLLIIVIFLTACNSKKKKNVDRATAANPQIITGDTVSNFFPVTAYLKGEIYGIK
ncbi:MAG: hypothetical protein LH615_14300, partial [Ferruginibacter sp.]|nr:hypothetical protein [Ferruginibacter sp.]